MEVGTGCHELLCYEYLLDNLCELGLSCIGRSVKPNAVYLLVFPGNQCIVESLHDPEVSHFLELLICEWLL